MSSFTVVPGDVEGVVVMLTDLAGAIERGEIEVLEATLGAETVSVPDPSGTWLRSEVTGIRGLTLRFRGGKAG